MSARPMAVVAITAALLASAACGSPSTSTTATTAVTTTAQDSGLDPATVAATVKAAAAAANAVHVTGSETDNGDVTTFDLQLNADSGQATATDQGVAEPMLLAGNVCYIRFTPAVVKANGMSAGDAKVLLNKWVPSTASFLPANTVTACKQMLDYSSFLSNAFNGVAGTLVKSGTDTVNGTPVVVYKDAAAHSTISVSTASPHYLVRLLIPNSIDYTFSAWNQPVAVTAPAKSETYSG